MNLDQIVEEFSRRYLLHCAFKTVFTKIKNKREIHYARVLIEQFLQCSVKYSGVPTCDTYERI